MMDDPYLPTSRRRLLGTALGAGIAFALPGLPAWARQPGYTPGEAETGDGRLFQLNIADTLFETNGKPGAATTINGTLPGPLLRFREGETVTIDVTAIQGCRSNPAYMGPSLSTRQGRMPYRRTANMSSCSPTGHSRTRSTFSPTSRKWATITIASNPRWRTSSAWPRKRALPPPSRSA